MSIAVASEDYKPTHGVYGFMIQRRREQGVGKNTEPRFDKITDGMDIRRVS